MESLQQDGMRFTEVLGMQTCQAACLLEEVGSLHVDTHGCKHNGKLLVLLLLIALCIAHHVCDAIRMA